MIISFIIQDLVKSQFINSLAGNLGTAISVIVAFLAGYIVDKKSPWKIMLLSDIILLPLLLGLFFILNSSISYKVILIFLVDIVLVLLDEFDSISRPKYLKMTLSSNDLDVTIQMMNGVQSIFSILGYLFVFLSVAFLHFNTYFIIIFIFYLISALSILALPRERKDISNKLYDSSDIVDGAKKVLKFWFTSKDKILLHSTTILYMLRNQMVMSLLIYRIGQLNETFDKIHIIGSGIVSGVGLGVIFNLILRKISFRKRKLYSNIIFFSSVFYCLYLGRVQSVESFYLLGLSIGLIFGSGLPLYNLLSSERLLITPKEIVGRSTAMLRMISILTVILTSLLLKYIDNVGIHSIYFDFGAVIVIVTNLLFTKIKFETLKNNTESV